MFERFDSGARTVVVHAQQHARRLGHRYIGGEHILLAVVSGDHPASAVLSAHGITPEYVEEEIVRRVGLGADAVPQAGTGLFGSLDRDALASIGIDLDAVRARIEASFGPHAFIRADEAARLRERGPRGRTGARRFWLDRRRALPRDPRRSWHRRRPRGLRGHGGPGGLRGTGGLRRTGGPCGTGGSEGSQSSLSQHVTAATPAQEPRPADATGRYCANQPTTGHIPFTPVAKKILELTLRETVKLHDSTIGAGHIALALTVVRQGLVPSILAAAGASGPALHAEIVDRYRQAS